MNVNYSLAEKNKEQANDLRSCWHPGASASEVRDAYVFTECITRFREDPKVLLPYIEQEPANIKTVQRLLQIRESAHLRLKELASSIDKPIACTMRGLISYWLNIVNAGTANQSFTPSKYQALAEMLADLEIQLFECINIFNKLSAAVKNELQKEVSQDE